MIEFRYNPAIAGIEKLVEKHKRNYVVVKQISDLVLVVTAIADTSFITAEFANDVDLEIAQDVGDMFTVPADTFTKICQIGNGATTCTVRLEHYTEEPENELDVSKKKTRVTVDNRETITTIDFYDPTRKVPDIANLGIIHLYDGEKPSLPILFSKELISLVNYFKKFNTVQTFSIHENRYTAFYATDTSIEIYGVTINDKETIDLPTVPYVFGNSINCAW